MRLYYTVLDGPTEIVFTGIYTDVTEACVSADLQSAKRPGLPITVLNTDGKPFASYVRSLGP